MAWYVEAAYALDDWFFGMKDDCDYHESLCSGNLGLGAARCVIVEAGFSSLGFAPSRCAGDWEPGRLGLFMVPRHCTMSIVFSRAAVLMSNEGLSTSSW